MCYVHNLAHHCGWVPNDINVNGHYKYEGYNGPVCPVDTLNDDTIICAMTGEILGQQPFMPETEVSAKDLNPEHTEGEEDDICRFADDFTLSSYLRRKPNHQTFSMIDRLLFSEVLDLSLEENEETVKFMIYWCLTRCFRASGVGLTFTHFRLRHKYNIVSTFENAVSEYWGSPGKLVKDTSNYRKVHNLHGQMIDIFRSVCPKLEYRRRKKRQNDGSIRKTNTSSTDYCQGATD